MKWIWLLLGAAMLVLAYRFSHSSKVETGLLSPPPLKRRAKVAEPTRPTTTDTETGGPLDEKTPPETAPASPPSLPPAPDNFPSAVPQFPQGQTAPEMLPPPNSFVPPPPPPQDYDNANPAPEYNPPPDRNGGDFNNPNSYPNNLNYPNNPNFSPQPAPGYPGPQGDSNVPSYPYQNGDNGDGG